MDGRTVVVTGGSSGVGYFTAERLAGLGARVVIAARDLDRTDRACRSIEAQVPGADVRAELLDLSSLASVREAASRLADVGRIDALVANGALVALPDHAKPREQRGHRQQVTPPVHRQRVLGVVDRRPSRDGGRQPLPDP